MKCRMLCALLLLAVFVQPVCAGDELSRAAVAGDYQLVQDLVKGGEKVNDIDTWGWTALMWAVYYGNTPVVKWLLEQGADPNIKTRSEYGAYLPGTTALILAAAYGHAEMIEALLKNKADAGYVDRKGRKAIDYAREFEFDKCVALLQGS